MRCQHRVPCVPHAELKLVARQSLRGAGTKVTCDALRFAPQHGHPLPANAVDVSAPFSSQPETEDNRAGRQSMKREMLHNRLATTAKTTVAWRTLLLR